MNKPVVDAHIELERMQGKGGWTYARIPGLTADKQKAFGWTAMKGSIDGHPIAKTHLMPIARSNGNMFLAVNAGIRKAIRKEAGDTVHIILYPDNDPLDIPDELMECLRDEPQALKFFSSLTMSEQKYYVNWVYGAKHEETKVRRIAEMINKLMLGLKMYQPRKD